MELPAGEERSTLEVLQESLQEELQQTRSELNEISRLLDQSQHEVARLTQRTASINTHLQQVQSRITSASISEVQAAYDAALEAQQRLLLMRGQVEKLQAEQNALQRHVQLLEQVMAALEEGVELGAAHGQRAMKSVEMMVQAQEAERRRLSRQMHDGPAQALSNFILQTEIAARLFDVNPEQAREELNALKATATSTFQQVRNFIFELRPMMLDDLGLIPTVKRYVDTYRDQTGVDIQIQVNGEERRLENYVEVLLFRSIQELLSNAVRHGQAQHINVRVDLTQEQVRVRVADDGKGFDPNEIDSTSGLGLRLLRDRVSMLGGTFEVESKIGQGAEVTFTVPATRTSVFV